VSKLDDVLPLPAQVEVRLVCPDVLVLRNVIPDWRDELIRVAEKTNRWQQSRQAHPNGDGLYERVCRTSHSIMLSTADPDYGPCFRRFEVGLLNAFHSGLLAYKAYNDFLNVTHDSGYELLRYQEGGQFGAHSDTILGKPGGFRQLSAVIYLNDDYTGGETYFPRQSLKFKAEAGDLLMFPSTFCYPHESLPVIKGTKYAIVTWFMANPTKPTEQIEETHGEQGEGDSGGGDPAADGGLRLHESAGGGPVAGEQAAPDREHPASVGGRAS